MSGTGFFPGSRIAMTLAGTHGPAPRRFHRPDAALRSPGTWGAGAATVTGHVRKENQDAVAILEAGAWRIGICADGLGGLLLGREASQLAVAAAAGWLRERLEPSAELGPDNLRGLALCGLCEAQAALEVRAGELGLPPGGGLRTTLTVVVAGPDHWAFAHAGDGFGLRLLAGPPGVESWLEPQKGAYANEVACSLGPRLEGMPRSGSRAWEPGETLAFGSDGIGDQVDLEGFGLHLLERVRTADQDLSNLCGELLDGFAELRSEAGYAFDDNLSLVLLRAPAAGAGPC